MPYPLIKFISLSLLLLISAFATSSQASFLDQFEQDEPKFLPAEQAFSYSEEQQGAELYVDWNVADEYYLYKKKMYLLQRSEQGKIKTLPVDYAQAGEQKFDEAMGDVVVFYGQQQTTFDLTQLDQNLPVKLAYQGCAEAGLCYPPQKKTLNIDWSAVNAAAQEQTLQSQQSTSQAASASVTPATNSQKDDWFAGRSWLAIIGIFFILGLGLTFTPCVLPMVPILTSIVVGSQKEHSARKGFVLSTSYVFGMAMTYAAAGLTVGLLGAGANITAWMQNPWVLSVFAALFVVLSFSMFGFYELQLPSKLQNKLNDLNQKQKGGQLFSVFIMGVLSALVVSPCVSAPLAGALVYISTTGDAWLGGSALLALGLGMGAPLIALGTSGASILPKAGGWMEKIKQFFGVLLLAVAVWLLARFVEGQFILLIAGILAIGYGMSFAPFSKPDSGKESVLKALGLVLVIYGSATFLGGLMGNQNPLKPLANIGGVSSANNSSSASQTVSPFTRIQAAELEQYLSQHDKVLLDFYADWCISCIEMEHKVFGQQDVQAQLKDVTWLQVDVTENSAQDITLMERFGIFGPPSILFFENGQELSQQRIIGEMNKQQFLQFTQSVFK